MATDQISKFILEAARTEETARQRVVPLVKTWEKTRLLEGLNDTDKFTLAQLLQNQANQLLKESSRTSTVMGGEEWNGIALPTIRKVFVDQLAKKLVHTQAMDKPSGLVFYLDFNLDSNLPMANNIYTADESVYGDTTVGTGGFHGADRFSYSINYYSASANVLASASVTDWSEIGFNDALSGSLASGQIFKYTVATSSFADGDFLAPETFTFSSASVTPLVLRRYNTVNGANFVFYVSASAITIQSGSAVNVEYTQQPMYYDRGDYEMGQAGVGAIRDINIKWAQKQIVAKTRKLRYHITPELIQDLQAYQSVDAQKELTNMISKFVTQEVDQEVLSMLSGAARGNVRYWSAKVGASVNGATGAYLASPPAFQLGPFEWYKTLGITIQQISNEIHRRTLMGGANFAIVSPKVATIIQSMNHFHSSTESGGQAWTAGYENAGTLFSTIKIYKNPYWKDNEILMGFKGSSFAETGAAYCTYVPMMMTPPLTDPEDFTIRQGLLSRDAKIVYRPEFYAKIFIRDLDTV